MIGTYDAVTNCVESAGEPTCRIYCDVMCLPPGPPFGEVSPFRAVVTACFEAAVFVRARPALRLLLGDNAVAAVAEA